MKEKLVFWAYGMVFLSTVLLVILACMHACHYWTGLTIAVACVGAAFSIIAFLEVFINCHDWVALLFRGSLVAIYLGTILQDVVPTVGNTVFSLGTIALLISVANACYWMATHNRDQVMKEQ